MEKQAVLRTLQVRLHVLCSTCFSYAHKMCRKKYFNVVWVCLVKISFYNCYTLPLYISHRDQPVFNTYIAYGVLHKSHGILVHHLSNHSEIWQEVYLQTICNLNEQWEVPVIEIVIVIEVDIVLLPSSLYCFVNVSMPFEIFLSPWCSCFLGPVPLATKPVHDLKKCIPVNCIGGNRG